MKCSCGVELFDKDIVDSVEISTGGYYLSNGMGNKEWYSTSETTHKLYRCPKCFKTKKVKL